MSSIKNKIKFFENKNKQEPNTTKPKTVNTINVKKNISHWNKIRQDVLNKPYISQTTYAFGRNQTTKIPIESKKNENLSIEKPSVVIPPIEKSIVQNSIVQNTIVQNSIVENDIENSTEHSFDNDDMWMNSIIN
tara:strand:+ start:752 stop:1153 length:402 start_codon:yes stop_codon:yes gene_type:complete